MKIYYRLININKNEHSIVVRYFTDLFDEESLATSKDAFGEIILNKNGSPVTCRTDYNITLYNNPNPSVDDLLTIIKENAPIDWFKLQESIQSNSSFSLESANNLLNVIGSFVSEEPVKSNII